MLGNGRIFLILVETDFFCIEKAKYFHFYYSEFFLEISAISQDDGACWDRWTGTGTVTGSIRWFWMLRSPAKTSNKGGSAGVRPLPLQCLSQFLSDGRKDLLLRGRMFCVLFTDEWPDIYSICFSQLNGGKDSLSLAGGFSAVIIIRLIRDN